MPFKKRSPYGPAATHLDNAEFFKNMSRGMKRSGKPIGESVAKQQMHEEVHAARKYKPTGGGKMGGAGAGHTWDSHGRYTAGGPKVGN